MASVPRGVVDNGNRERRLLSTFKSDIVNELDLSRLLTILVRKQVLSYADERDILASADRHYRADLFVDRLASKGPEAFREFCVALERTCPSLLSRILLRFDEDGKLDEKSTSSMAAVEALKAGCELAIKERDAAQRMFVQTQDQLDSVVRQFQEMKRERDLAFEQLQHENSYRYSFRDDDIEHRNRVNLQGSHRRRAPPSPLPVSGFARSAQQWDAAAGDAAPATGAQSTWHRGDEFDESGDKVVYETFTVVLSRVPNYGFGIAVSGGRDNPHFANGDPTVVVSDVLKHGPAEGKLLLEDRIMSVNGFSFENVDHATAISTLKDSGQSVTMVVRRKATVTSRGDFEQPFKVTLAKKNKKDDYGVVLGYKLYIKELVPNSLASQDGSLREGDSIVKLNGTSIENMSLTEAKKQIEKSKDKLQLVVARSAGQIRTYSSPLNDHSDVTDHLPRTPNGKPVSEHPVGTSPSRNLTTELGPVQPSSSGTSEGTSRPTGQDAIERSPYNMPTSHPTPPTGTIPGDPRQRSYGPVSEYPPYSPTNNIYGYGYAGSPSDVDTVARQSRSEPRYISFRKEGGVGIRISGGNRTGIFVAKVAPQTPAEQRGLREGDMILKVNDIDLYGKTREEAVLLLLGLRDHVSLLVQFRRYEYEKLMSEGGTGDHFYIRTHFSYTVTEHREMSFKRGDIFLVSDTLFGGVVGSWQAMRVMRHPPHDTKKGIIPNLSRAEQLVLAQYSNKENHPVDDNKTAGPTNGRSASPGGFFRKRNTMRSKSLGKDNWDSAFFEDSEQTPEKKTGPRSNKFPAYERVVLKDPAFIRPLVIFGPLADVARDKLINEYPERFEAPRSDVNAAGDRTTKSGIIKLSNIREIIDKRRHCVLDVTPNAVDRLNYAQYAPIIVFLRAENKHAVKEMRQQWARQSVKSHRKLYEQAVRLEKSFSHLFTFTIPLTNGSGWFKKLKEAIEKSQMERVWMSEVKPDVSRDEVLFPLTGHRLSFVSSPESDYDTAGSRPGNVPRDHEHRAPSAPWNKLARASSDPSIATVENPGVEIFPGVTAAVSGVDVPSYGRDARHMPRSQMPPLSSSHPVHYQRSVSGNVNDVGGQQNSNQDYSYYPETTTQTTSSRSRRHPDPFYRSGIDSYVTLTPSEKMRHRHGDSGRRYYDGQFDYPPPQTSSYVSHRVPADSPQFVRGSRDPSPPYGGHQERLVPPPVPSGGDLRNYGYRGPEPVTPDYRDDKKNGPGPLSYAVDPHYRSSPSKADDSRLHPRHAGPPPSHPPPPAPHGSIWHPQQTNGDPSYHPSVGPSRSYNGRMTEVTATQDGYSASGSMNDRVDYLFRRQVEADRSAASNEVQTAPDGHYQTRSLVDSSRYPVSANNAWRDRQPNYGDNGFDHQPVVKSSNPWDSRTNGTPSGTESVVSTDRYKTGASTDSHPRQHGDSSYSNESTRSRETRQDPESRNEFETRQPVSVNSKKEPRGSAFESYKKPSSLTGGTSEQDISGAKGQTHLWENSAESEEHPVVATAKGTFDSKGGVLESRETGVSIVIPPGAIPDGIRQEIYFKVCQDNSIMPPLDKEKGETLLSPLVMCGPHGLQFKLPVELRLPHCASVNPESWSFALKSSDSPSGHPSHWQNMTLAGVDGVSQGRVGKSSVSVLVDHF